MKSIGKDYQDTGVIIGAINIQKNVHDSQTLAPAIKQQQGTKQNQNSDCIFTAIYTNKLSLRKLQN